jgi:hypothetical protein
MAVEETLDMLVATRAAGRASLARADDRKD